MTDRERINALLDQMSELQKQNKDLKTYTEILENLLGVVHLESLD
jgi:hypothetical protein